MPRVLLIEDEKLFAKSVQRHLQRAGYHCDIATTLRGGTEKVQSTAIDILMLDVRLPDGNGLDLLKQLRQDGSPFQALPIVVMTAFGAVEDAVNAMKMGASDYLKKPVDMEELVLVLEKVKKTQKLSQQIEYSQTRARQTRDKLNMIGSSPSFTALRQQLKQVANAMDSSSEHTPVLLLAGETGTGKTLAAQFFHQSAPWSTAPFVQVDCSAIQDESLEAELYGVDDNQLSSKHTKTIGLIEAAESGTVFLDGIDALSLSSQAKLLRVIECRMVRPVGAEKDIYTHAHFVVATNRNLADMVEQGSFRSDLYYRLNVVEIVLPLLHDRQQDIAELAQFYIEKFARQYGVAQPRLDYEAMRDMQQYAWPGNIRELQHVLERAVMLCNDGVINKADLLLKPNAHANPVLDKQLKDMTLEQVEKYLLERALQQTNGNVSKAARQLGLTRMAMRYRMEKYQL